MSVITGYDATNFPQDLLFGSGVVFVGAVPIGTTMGGVKFNPGKTIEQVGFDGKHADVEGLDRTRYGTSTLSFVMQELGDSTTGDQIAALEAGSASASDGGTPPITTVTPKASGLLLATGDYLTDVRLYFDRGGENSGKYAVIYFPKAVCTKYDLAGQSANSGQVNVEFSARVPAGSALNIAPYKIEYRTNLPS